MIRKIGICVGQNEYDPNTTVTPLRGCVNDALLIGEMLKKAGYTVIQLHDKQATQAAILQSLKTEVEQLREGDFLVFWNSSHGYQVPDKNPDETDTQDEAICSYDTNFNDPLIDDKFREILQRVPKQANVFFGSDSCHSGTVTRELIRMVRGLPFDTNGKQSRSGPEAQTQSTTEQTVWQIIAHDPAVQSLQFPIGKATVNTEALIREATTRTQASTNTVSSQSLPTHNAPISDDWKPRLFVPQSFDLLIHMGQTLINLDDYMLDGQGKQAAGTNLASYVSNGNTLKRLARGSLQEQDMTHVLLSGCQPEEVSWDAPFTQGFHGAMTYYFAMTVLDAWRKKQAITYKEAHQKAGQQILGSRFNQHPQLEGPDTLKDMPVFGYVP